MDSSTENEIESAPCACCGEEGRMTNFEFGLCEIHHSMMCAGLWLHGKEHERDHPNIIKN